MTYGCKGNLKLKLILTWRRGFEKKKLRIFEGKVFGKVKMTIWGKSISLEKKCWEYFWWRIKKGTIWQKEMYCMLLHIGSRSVFVFVSITVYQLCFLSLSWFALIHRWKLHLLSMHIVILKCYLPQVINSERFTGQKFSIVEIQYKFSKPVAVWLSFHIAYVENDMLNKSQMYVLIVKYNTFKVN